jgi:hypothetical protein
MLQREFQRIDTAKVGGIVPVNRSDIVAGSEPRVLLDECHAVTGQVKMRHSARTTDVLDSHFERKTRKCRKDKGPVSPQPLKT